MKTNTIWETLRKNTMLIVMLLVVVLFEILNSVAGRGSILSPTNVTNLINQNSYVVILATGMLLCILTGGNIDLSVGSVVALIGAVAGVLIVNKGMNVYLAIIICLLLGILIGAWQGFWIAYIRLPAFIVTLAGMLLWRGVALLVLNGLTISPFPSNYLGLFNNFLPSSTDRDFIYTVTIIVGVIAAVIIAASVLTSRLRKKKKGYMLSSGFSSYLKLAIICGVILWLSYLLGQNKGIPIILIIIAVIVLIYSYITSRTVPGRHLYAVGGNEKAARLSGINTDKVIFLSYTNMSFLSAVAALVVVARFNSAAPSAGTNYEMDAIASCYIGGASAYGGIGTVGGAVIGAIFMGILNNGMSIMGIDANWQRVIKGAVLLAAVAFDVISKKRGKVKN